MSNEVIYGEIAKRAAAKIVSYGITSRDAWNTAFHEFKPWTTSQPCPRAAFFGLCSEGLVRGCQSGNYTTSQKNKQYVITAYEHIKNTPEDANADTKELWARLGNTTGYKYQLDVLLSLYREGLLR